MSNILTELAKPFHPTHVEWKPGSMTGDQKKALALAYADLRAYQNRLDEVCGIDWSVTYTPWGENRIICHLTINGVTRSSTGESDSAAERSEIAGTATEAQAFKRACSMFQLGRYLYNLPSVWVEYDAQSKAFTANAQSRLTGVIAQHFQRYNQGIAEAPDTVATVQPPTVPPVQPVANEDADGGPLGANAAPYEPEETIVPSLAVLHSDINYTGTQLFANQWIVAGPWLVQLWTTKTTPTNIRTKVVDLNVDESDRFLSGMVQHSAAVLAEWKKHLENEAITTMPPTATKRTVARNPVSATRPAPSPRRTVANGTPRERF